jgi:hypothetical protein
VAADRKLLAPTPIPLRWTLSGDGVDGAVSAAVADAGLRPAFSPLPGLVAVGQDAMLAGGGQTELHAIYGGLGSGRLLLAGTPGAGKTGAGILLLLDALAYRRTRKETERSEVPVPVILALTDWQAATRAFEDWVADRLAATVAFLSGRRGRADAAALIDAGQVSVILDGLDEIPAHLRPMVLEALSQTRLRVVLLTRTAALLEASGTSHLVDAPVVHLQPVPARVAADYLDRALPGPPPHG